MKKMTRLFTLVLALVMALCLTACGSAPAAEEAEITNAEQATTPDAPVVLKLGTTVNEEDSFHIAATKFADLVFERTNGAYQIEIYL